MHGPKAYSYAVLRVVPRVERDEFINAGVILFSQEYKFLAARVYLDEQRIRAFAPLGDFTTIRRHLETIPRICSGDLNAGPIAALPKKDRFHWLAAPRSTMIQTSPIRTGLTVEPQETLAHLARVLTS